MYVCIYQHLRTSSMPHKVYFMRNLTGLNSEFSYCKTGGCTKAKEISLPYYFTHGWKENSWINPKGFSAMRNANSIIKDVLNLGRCFPFLRWLSIILNPSAFSLSLAIYIYIYIYISKVGDVSRGWPEVSLFNCYNARRERYSISWIAPLYPWSLPYIGECWARRHQEPFLSL